LVDQHCAGFCKRELTLDVMKMTICVTSVGGQVVAAARLKAGEGAPGSRLSAALVAAEKARCQRFLGTRLAPGERPFK